jgi:hypothetical protein
MQTSYELWDFSEDFLVPTTVARVRGTATQPSVPIWLWDFTESWAVPCVVVWYIQSTLDLVLLCYTVSFVSWGLCEIWDCSHGVVLIREFLVALIHPHPLVASLVLQLSLPWFNYKPHHHLSSCCLWWNLVSLLLWLEYRGHKPCL